MKVFMEILRMTAFYTIICVAREGIGYKIAAFVAAIAIMVVSMWETLNN